MATESGRKSPPLVELLAREPFRFEFFQAVRILARARRAALPDKARPVGQTHAPDQEVVRFRANPSLSFAPSDIAAVTSADAAADPTVPAAKRPGSGAPELAVNFMGLTGPAGVLPQHYTAMMIRHVRECHSEGRTAAPLRDFFDLFNHRVISLFYRAWEKHHFPRSYERLQQDSPGSDGDLMTRMLYSLIGLGTDHLRGRQSFPDELFVYYAGHFARQPRSAAALEGILIDHFGVRAQVIQFIGQWLELDPHDRSAMPSRETPYGLNNALGRTAVLGNRVWDVQSRFRLRLGPLTYEQYRMFLPDGSAFRPCTDLARAFAGPDFDFDIQPVLSAAAVPRMQLGSRQEPKRRIGRDIWLRSPQPYSHDFQDAIFTTAQAVSSSATAN